MNAEVYDMTDEENYDNWNMKYEIYREGVENYEKSSRIINRIVEFKVEIKHLLVLNPT